VLVLLCKLSFVRGGGPIAPDRLNEIVPNNSEIGMSEGAFILYYIIVYY
jgi:hypothetical protein